MESVAVVIATFGDDPEWEVLSARAIESVRQQTVPTRYVYHHGPTLAEARNRAAFDADDSDWFCFLDADDELDPLYVESMLGGSGDLRQPSTLGIVNGVADDYPVLIPERDLKTSNYLVIGTLIRREMFLEVGGFDPTLPILEDWDLFLRLWLNGASISQCPDAIYRVHVRPNSRNSDRLNHGKVYSLIRRKYKNQVPCQRNS